MILFNFFIFLLTIFDFLALHDIAKDYLSREALKFAEITTAVPAWTAAEGEWLIVEISLLARVLFLLANIFLLWSLRPQKERGF
jgi:hypothetical protein